MNLRPSWLSDDKLCDDLLVHLCNVDESSVFYVCSLFLRDLRAWIYGVVNEGTTADKDM